MNRKKNFGIITEEIVSGYGLVVEHVLAKDETGVRFSLPAPTPIKVYCINLIGKPTKI